MGLREEQIDFVEYRDIGSGYNSKRKRLQQLLCEIKQKNIDYLYVYNLNRIGRNAVELLDILKEVEKNNTSFVSVMDGLNSETPADKIFMFILALVADIERETLKNAV